MSTCSCRWHYLGSRSLPVSQAFDTGLRKEIMELLQELGAEASLSGLVRERLHHALKYIGGTLKAVCRCGNRHRQQTRSAHAPCPHGGTLLGQAQCRPRPQPLNNRSDTQTGGHCTAEHVPVSRQSKSALRTVRRVLYLHSCLTSLTIWCTTTPYKRKPAHVCLIWDRYYHGDWRGQATLSLHVHKAAYSTDAEDGTARRRQQ